MTYAEVLLSQKVGNDKETLTYKIPEQIKASVGSLVIVPLRNKATPGIIIDIHNQKPDFRTLEINKLVLEKSILNTNQIKLLQWMNDQYFCPKSKLIKLLVPKRVMLDKIMKSKEPKSAEQILRTRIKELNEEQSSVIRGINESKLNKFLIQGVTGSGKTEIYLRLAEKYISNQKQVLIVVPEISLTPQTIDYFEKSLGVKANVVHSKISETQRQKDWKEIWSNKAKLVIGSRSAIFAPFQDLKLIIIDEEHETSYKQDTSPRYHTHEIAEKLQEFDQEIKIIYGSATPSIETAEKLQNATFKLTKRIGESTLPQIEIVDLRQEFQKRNNSIFSESLKEAMNNALAKKEQIILFLNRRGSASSVVCRDCGYIEKCKHCDSAMTHHGKTIAEEKLICHHCGILAKTPTTCSNCKGANIRFLGIGTEKIEKDAKKEFPNARILRADKDSTSKKDSFNDIYKKFKNHEADILIGTQMIAKGLHLPKVNLVGVILADVGLNIPDYKTTERNFQLMMQVAGRAGRNSNDGKVIIQTYNPDNTALLSAQKHSYEEFFKYERVQRKILSNPPFGQIAKIIVQDKSLEKCRKETEKVFSILKDIADEETEINSYPAYLSRLRGKYRYIIFLKDKSNTNLLHNLIAKLPKEYIINPNIKIDINPLTTT